MQQFNRVSKQVDFRQQARADRCRGSRIAEGRAFRCRLFRRPRCYGHQTRPRLRCPIIANRELILFLVIGYDRDSGDPPRFASL